MNSKQRRKAYRALPAIGSMVSVYGERVRVIAHPPPHDATWVWVADSKGRQFLIPLVKVSDD